MVSTSSSSVLTQEDFPANSNLDKAKWTVGLWPVKSGHILYWDNTDTQMLEQIKDMSEERKLAAAEFLRKELKWNNEMIINTKWSPSQEILWVQLKDETVV